MAKKIAKVDADAMNSLYASELNKKGIKNAADDKGIINAPQAFEDHESYLSTLAEIMKADGKTDFNPNDEQQD
jgi:hypothetical protein